MDEPVVYAIVDALPAGDALDAACGTGRFGRHLAARGHHVIGVDRSPHMLDVARAKLPNADFRLGELQTLPVDDAAVDLVMCGLAGRVTGDAYIATTCFRRRNVYGSNGDALIAADGHVAACAAEEAGGQPIRSGSR